MTSIGTRLGTKELGRSSHRTIQAHVAWYRSESRGSFQCRARSSALHCDRIERGWAEIYEETAHTPNPRLKADASAPGADRLFIKPGSEADETAQQLAGELIAGRVHHGFGGGLITCVMNVRVSLPT